VAVPTDPPYTPAGDFLADINVTRDDAASGHYTLDLSPAWDVFYTFGGVSMAIALRAIERELARDDFGPITATAVYVQPVESGPVEVDVGVLRNGRSAAQATADLRNPHHEGTALHVTATFGQPHDSFVDYVDATFPDVPPPEDCDPPPPRPEDSPFSDIRFHEQTDWRPITWWDAEDWVSSPAEALSWTRFLKEPRRPDGTIDPISLAVPADTLGGAVGRRVGPSPFFVLTLELGIHFFATTTSPWVLQHVVSPRAGDGYASGHVHLWDDERKLLGFATQRARLRPVEVGERFGKRS
jgi:acyl-CoA thioesterase